MNIQAFIDQNNLQPCDAVELVCPAEPFIKHSAVFLKSENGEPAFIANIVSGIQIIEGEQLLGFIEKYQVVSIERYNGTAYQREANVRRALGRLGEKTYHLIYHNCEHFKNWVLYGKSKSVQVISLAFGLLIGGGVVYLIGKIFDNKFIRRTGLFVVLIVIAVFIAGLIYLVGAVKDDEIDLPT